MTVTPEGLRIEFLEQKPDCSSSPAASRPLLFAVQLSVNNKRSLYRRGTARDVGGQNRDRILNHINGYRRTPGDTSLMWGCVIRLFLVLICPRY